MIEKILSLAPNRAHDSFFCKLPSSIKIYCVGGAVRDFFLNKKVSDRDYLLVGADLKTLQQFNLKAVGKNFPVFLHPETSEEIALARTEKKIGKGYKGFIFHTDSAVLVEHDLRRRDLTINAMAVDESGALLDPFNGRKDIENKLLKHVSPSFAEDPLRLMRLARFYACMRNFKIDGQTKSLCRQIIDAGELKYLSGQRIWQELSKGLESPDSIKMIRALQDFKAWKEITGQDFTSHSIAAFLDSTWGCDLPVNWKAGVIFKNYDINTNLCFFPKSVTNSIISLKRAERVLKTYSYNLGSKTILKLAEIGNLFRAPAEIPFFLRSVFYRDTDKILVMEKLISRLIEWPIGDIVKNTKDKEMLREKIISARLDFLEKELCK